MDGSSVAAGPLFSPRGTLPPLLRHWRWFRARLVWSVLSGPVVIQHSLWDTVKRVSPRVKRGAQSGKLGAKYGSINYSVRILPYLFFSTIRSKYITQAPTKELTAKEPSPAVHKSFSIHPFSYSVGARAPLRWRCTCKVFQWWSSSSLGWLNGTPSTRAEYAVPRAIRLILPASVRVYRSL